MIDQLCGMRTVSLVSAVLVLSACNSTGGGSSTSDALDLNQQETAEQAPIDQSKNLRAFCPKTVIRAGTETYRTFENGVNKDDPGALNSLEFQATITETVRECNYSPNNLNIRVGVRGRVINGPTGATGSINTPVRVAVVNVANDVLYSELHTVQAAIPEGGTHAKFSFVDGNINLPVPEKPNIVIYVGFDEGPPDAKKKKKLKKIN